MINYNVTNRPAQTLVPNRTFPVRILKNPEWVLEMLGPKHLKCRVSYGVPHKMAYSPYGLLALSTLCFGQRPSMLQGQQMAGLDEDV